MTLLPVVHRGLRVASRERNTYRIRFLAALLPVLFNAFSLWFVTLLHERPIPPRELFLALTWIEYVFVLLAGFCLTADTISEEKRENTLGLPFLTDLGGLDVVLGKLAGAGVRGVYATAAGFSNRSHRSISAAEKDALVADENCLISLSGRIPEWS